MKMKNLFKFFSMMVLILMGQSAWAQGSTTITQRWDGDNGLNSIVPGESNSLFKQTTTDGLLTVSLASYGHNVEYVWSTEANLIGSSRRLRVGHVYDEDGHREVKGAISWKVNNQDGFTAKMVSVKTATAIAGEDCSYALGGNAAEPVGAMDVVDWVEQTSDSSDFKTATNVPYIFKAGPDRQCYRLGFPASCEEVGKGAAFRWLEVKYQINPDAPKWVDGAENNMFVTVDDYNWKWYVLRDQVNINSKFENTLKFDVKVTKGKEKYLFWNADSTAFYMLKPMSFDIVARIEEKAGEYAASELSDTLHITAQIPDEDAQVFFYVDDERLYKRDAEGNYSMKFLVSDPNEHFVEYVYAAKKEHVEYDNQTTNSFEYSAKKFPRYDYFYVKKGLSETENPQDSLTVHVDVPKYIKSTLLLNAIGAEKNRVEFTLNKDNESKIFSTGENIFGDDDADWRESYSNSYLSGESADFKNSIVFFYDINGRRERNAYLDFKGIPDKLYFKYKNIANTHEADARMRVSYATTDNPEFKDIETIEGKPSGYASYEYQLPLNANRVRFTYWGASREASLIDVRITERKEVVAANDTIKFDLTKRAPGQVLTKVDSLTWVNLAPRLTFTADAPFTPKSRLKVRLDEFDTIPSNNLYRVELDRDTVGEFLDTMVIASMDSPDPIVDTVILMSKVIFDTEDMFAKVNGQDRDTINYGDTAMITIVDKLGTELYKHDSLIISYEYNSTKMSIDENGIVRDICVGIDTIIVKAADNSFVPGGWADTLYIDAREKEADSLTFTIPAEIGMKDTLPADFVVALDSVATLSYEFDKPEYFKVTDEGRLVALKNDKADSVWVKVTASQTCEHFAYTDSVRVWVRRVVTTEFNDSVKWMTNVFGNDTLNNPLFVKNDEGTEFENTDSLTIVFEYTPDSVVVDTVANQWYLRRSYEDSLFVKVTVSGDSIKTVKDSIKFPVREYKVKIEYPTVDAERGWYVGDTLYHKDFKATATNPERAGKDLTNLVMWTKTAVDSLDATVLDNGDVILDSINVNLSVCVDTLFAENTCLDTALAVQPAKLAKWEFPGAAPTDSIFTVGDSILVEDLVVEDIFGRPIDKYVRYDFSYVPSDFAHHSNAEGLSVMTDYIVLDKNGLDTTAVDSVISFITGGLVEDTLFRDRLLVAPVYPVEAQLTKLDWTVGDTVSVAALKASKELVVLDNKGYDVTRYSTFALVAADSVAQFIDDSTLMLMRAGSIKLKMIAKQNGSMKARMFTKYLNVAPVMADTMVGIADSYTVFDVLDTKTLAFYDANGRDLKDITKAYKVAYTIDGDAASVDGDKINFNHVGNVTINAAVSVDATGDLKKENVSIVAYKAAKIVYDTTAFVVGDEFNFNLFSVENAEGEKIDSKYYTLSYVVDTTKATMKADSTAMVLDTTLVTIEVTLHSDDIEIDAQNFDIEAGKLTVDRLVFPEKADGNYLVRQGLDIKDIKVYDVRNKDITNYAQKNEFIEFTSDRTISVEGDSIFFLQEGMHTITTEIGDALIENDKFTNKIYVEQMEIDSIVLPSYEFTVLDTLYAEQIKAFVKGEDVTDYIKDITLSMSVKDGRKVEGGYVMINSSEYIGEKIEVTTFVTAKTGGKFYMQKDSIKVNKIAASYMVLPAAAGYTVFDKIVADDIEYYDARDRKINEFVINPSFQETVPAGAAALDNGNIVLKKSGDITLTMIVNGNAEGTVSVTITDVAKYANAKIKNYKHDAQMEVGSVLTPEDFYLVNAEDETITPDFTTIVLSIKSDDEAEGRAVMDGKNIVFKKAKDVTIYANVESDAVEAPQYEKPYRNISKIEADTIVYPRYNYTVGESINISDLRLYADDEDITDTYGKGAIKQDAAYYTFAPEQAGHVEDGKIYLDRSGLITITAIVVNDSVASKPLSNVLFVDHLVADRIVFPEGPFTVGDTIRASQFAVVDAKGNDISAYADVEIYVDKAYAHFIDANVMILDVAVNDIKLYAEVKGNFGVKTIKQDSTISVVPVKVVDMEFPAEPYKVFGSVDTKDIVFLDAKGRDITKYATNVVAAINQNGEVKDGKIFFTKAGDAEISIEVEAGNAETDDALIQPIKIEKYADAQIIFNGESTYTIADVIETKDFALVDADGKKLDIKSAVISIKTKNAAASHAEGTAAIQLDLTGEQYIVASVAENDSADVKSAEFKIAVYKAKAAYVEYPNNKVFALNSTISTENLKVRDAKNRIITSYANRAFNFDFEPSEAAEYKDGEITFKKAGNVSVKAWVSNDSVETVEPIVDILVVKQQEPTSIELIQDNFQVGDTMLYSNVKLLDQDGAQIYVENEVIFANYNMDEAHAIKGGIVFDVVKAAANPFKFMVGTKGYDDIAKKAFDASVVVAPRDVDTIILPFYETEVMGVMNVNDIQILDIYGNDIRKYNPELKYEVAAGATLQGDQIIFENVDSINGIKVTVKVGGNAKGIEFDYVKVTNYTKASVKFNRQAKYYVADEIKLSDFTLVDADGKAIDAKYATIKDFSCAAGSKEGKVITLDKAGETIVNVEVEGMVEIAAEKLAFDLTVNQANLAYIIYEDKPYVVGDSMQIADNDKILYKDSINRDITRYAAGVIRSMEFTGKDASKIYAQYKNGKVYFFENGEVKVKAVVGNDQIAVADIYDKWYINKREAASFKLVDRQRYVGDTLLMSDVTIYDEFDNDITDADKLFFIYDNKQAHGVVGSSDIVLDKAMNEFALKIAIKGYDNVQKYAFDTTLKVLPRKVDTIILPEKAGGYEVLDSLYIDKIQVLDKFGHDLTKAPYNYATLEVTPAESAKKLGDKLVFYEAGQIAITLNVSGNADGADVQRVEVAKNTTATITVPEKNVYYVGDEIKLSAFDLVDKNGKKFDAAYSLSFDIAEGFGRKSEDGQTIVIDSLTEDFNAKFFVAADGQVNIDTMEFVPTVKPCEVKSVVFPDIRFIVGDSIAIDSLVLLDAVNKDLTRYAEYRGFEFELASAASFDLEKGYIYFLEPGVVKVTTKVGFNKMKANDNLVNKIFIEQADADSVAIVNNVRTVGDTLDIKDVEAFDKNGNKLTKYADLQFVFTSDAAHYAETGMTDKIILDKAGEKTISILVDGRKGVEQKTLVPVLTVNRVAVDSVAINGEYKVTGIIATSAVQAFAANGLDITRYVGTITYSIDPQVAEAKGADYMFIKSGDQTINVVLNGADIVETTVPVVKNIAKCEAARVTFPEDTLRVGDIIKKEFFQVFDADDMNITRFADIKFTFDPTTAAELTGDGDIKIKATGTFTLCVTVSRDVELRSFTADYFVRHKITDDQGKDITYDLLVQVWEDLIVVDNNNDDLPKFEKYQWFMDEKEIVGQTSQNFYVRDADRDGNDHVIYVIATANGKTYLIKERTFNFGKKTTTPARFIAYPALLKSNSQYNVEAGVDGEVIVTNVNGATVDQYRVESGKQSVVAPKATGVYVIRYQAADGQTATQKMIVK